TAVDHHHRVRPSRPLFSGLRWLAISAAVAALLAGCASTGPEAGGEGGSNVLETLRQIDACKLLDSTVVPAADLGSGPPQASAPHKCGTPAPRADLRIGLPALTVVLGVPVSPDAKWDLAPIEVAGVKAYRSAVATDHSSCHVVVPVSFELGIRFQTTRSLAGSAMDVCAVATAAAAAAVPRLAKPAELALDPNAPTLARWDGCALLSAALSDSVKGMTLQLGQSDNGLDACEAAPKDRMPGDRGPELHTSIRGDPAIMLTKPALFPGSRAHTVEGKQGVLSQSAAGGCEFVWSHGPATPQTGPPATGNFDLQQLVTVRTQDCEHAGQLAIAVIRALGSPPPAGTPAQLRPYRPDEPDDDPARGGCIHRRSTGDEDCEPLRPVAVPDQPAALVAAASTDPHVTCSAALAAVRHRLGEQMAAVVEPKSRNCLFVEPTHSLTITVAFPEIRLDPRLLPKSARDRNDAELAGHPAMSYFAGAGGERFEVLAAINAASDAGMVRIVGEFTAPRGSPSHTVADTSKAPLLREVMAELLTEHFD
ncbi:MAG: hypothetical protein M3443_18680, partial [Actinomycetota bacterium]|nr:hypothetical protein [Actinomycetota bacterium]